MIRGLKPYPAYKDSGVQWLGEVPEHWETGTLRHRLRAYDGIKIGPFGSQLKLEYMNGECYKVYGQANVIASDFCRGNKFVDNEKFGELLACEVRPGDLLLTMMGSSGRCTLVPNGAEAGIMDSHHLRLRPKASSFDGQFTALVIDQAQCVKDQFAVAGKGSIMHGLNSSVVKNLVLALPPLPEQRAIVRFLDHADRRIRRYIRTKQKLIKLLEEHKQAIVHRAVTRGLDSNVRLKPSGVEWLGDVPAHWEVVRLKQVTTSIEQGWSPQCDAQRVSDDEWGVLKVGCVNRDAFDERQNKKLPSALEPIPTLQIRDGDILVSRANTRELLGLAALATNPRRSSSFATSCLGFVHCQNRPNHDFLSTRSGERQAAHKLKAARTVRAIRCRTSGKE